MCTVSVIAIESGFRLACNRDERLTRPIALPPVIRRFGEHDAILPIDPASDGTWIAASDAGLAFVLLNVNPPLRRTLTQSPPLSRGLIIPSLLDCDDVAEVIARADQLDFQDYSPFRFLLVSPRRCCEFAFDGRTMRRTVLPFDGAPIMFTSSGLGDDLVEFPRRLLFDQLIRSGSMSPARQDEFHEHQWHDRPHL